jgi:hypothetical protein
MRDAAAGFKGAAAATLELSFISSSADSIFLRIYRRAYLADCKTAPKMKAVEYSAVY